MKTNALVFIIICTLGILYLANGAYSQETIEVKVKQAQMSKGIQPGYVVEIPEVTLKEVQQNWTRKLQENSKVKVVSSGDELSLSHVLKPSISTDTISIYSLIIEKESRVILHVFLEKDSAFFTPSEDKTDLSADKTDSGLKKYIRDFAVEQYRLGATADRDAEQKILSELENDLKKLEKENENLEKDISSLENDIDKTERKITDMEKEIDLKNQEILAHATGMQGLLNDTDKKAAEDKKKDLDKEKNKLEKERTRAKNDISDMKSKIKKNENTIEENLSLIEEKKAEINTQKEDVAKAQLLLDGIR